MIGPIDKQPIRLERTEAPRPAEETRDAPGQSRRIADRVEISAEGRELAARFNDVPGLDPQRVAEIRQKIADGSYNAPEVLDAVARRILERGDV